MGSYLPTRQIHQLQTQKLGEGCPFQRHFQKLSPDGAPPESAAPNAAHHQAQPWNLNVPCAEQALKPQGRLVNQHHHQPCDPLKVQGRLVDHLRLRRRGHLRGWPGRCLEGFYFLADVGLVEIMGPRKASEVVMGTPHSCKPQGTAFQVFDSVSTSRIVSL